MLKGGGSVSGWGRRRRMGEAGFREAGVERLVGPGSMVVGFK